MTVLQNPTRNKTLYTQIVFAAARFYCTSDKIRDKKEGFTVSAVKQRTYSGTHRRAAIKEALTDKIKKKNVRAIKVKQFRDTFLL